MVGAVVGIVTLVLLINGVIFALFHAPALNGDLPSLLVILLDGTTMVAINSVTGRLSTSILAHMGNNTLSFLLKGSILSVAGLPPFVFPALQVVIPLIVPMALVTFALVKRRQLRLGRN